MATIRKPKAKAKPRTRPRVEDTESGRAPVKSVDRGSVTALHNGNLEVAYQLAETVPVAQYANVVIGPVALRWQVQNPGIEKLGPVDWEADDLSEEQQAIYDTVRGWLRATGKLIEHSISEDREIVEESVRLHNEREAAEAEAAKKSSRRR